MVFNSYLNTMCSRCNPIRFRFSFYSLTTISYFFFSFFTCVFTFAIAIAVIVWRCNRNKNQNCQFSTCSTRKQGYRFIRTLFASVIRLLYLVDGVLLALAPRHQGREYEKKTINHWRSEHKCIPYAHDTQLWDSAGEYAITEMFCSIFKSIYNIVCVRTYCTASPNGNVTFQRESCSAFTHLCAYWYRPHYEC